MLHISGQEHTTKSDEELVILYKENKDLEILGVLYARYTSLVYGLSLKYLKNKDDSQDVVMQVFEKLIDKLLDHNVDNFKSWLYVLSKNHCLMKLRKDKALKSSEVDIDSVNMENQVFLHHDDDGELEDDLIKLEECIKRLKADQKRCVELFFLEKKCYREIEETTKFKLKKVKSYIQNGKRNLKICMEENE